MNKLVNNIRGHINALFSLLNPDTSDLVVKCYIDDVEVDCNTFEENYYEMGCETLRSR